MQIYLDEKIYPKESILNTCYFFLDRAYIFLKNEGKERIVAELNPKKQLKNSLKEEERLKKDFLNELIHQALRYEVSRNNKKLREMIVGRALTSVAAEPTPLDSFAQKSHSRDSYLKDPLGIAIPWEEKFGKKKCRS